MGTAKLKDIEMDNVSLSELVEFARTIHPAIMKAVVKEVFPEPINMKKVMEKAPEYMILVQEDILDFTVCGTLDFKVGEGPVPSPMVTKDLELIKAITSKMVSDGIDKDIIQVVQRVEI